jgi:hypothetical protein
MASYTVNEAAVARVEPSPSVPPRASSRVAWNLRATHPEPFAKSCRMSPWRPVGGVCSFVCEDSKAHVTVPDACPIRGSARVNKGHHRTPYSRPDLQGRKVRLMPMPDDRQFLNRVSYEVAGNPRRAGGS